MAPLIALAVCSLSVLEVCSHVAGPPFTASSLLADQDRCAGWRKTEEHTSPPIPVLTSPDSVLVPCEPCSPGFLAILGSLNILSMGFFSSFISQSPFQVLELINLAFVLFVTTQQLDFPKRRFIFSPWSCELPPHNKHLPFASFLLE